jgi:hypothetical protein
MGRYSGDHSAGRGWEREQGQMGAWLIKPEVSGRASLLR